MLYPTLIGAGLALLVGCSCNTLREQKNKPFPFGDAAHIVVFDLGHGLAEASSGGGLSLQPAADTFSAVALAAQRVLAQKSTKGVFLRLGMQSLSFAQSRELGGLFAGARTAGIAVYCQADTLSNAALGLTLAACDETWLSPAGGIDAVGIGGQSLYAKGLLERLHVSAEFLHMGRYKSAAETFTREGPSEAAEESTLSLLGSIRTSWHDGVREASGSDALVSALEDGPYDALTSLRLELVQHVGFESDAREALTEKLQLDRFVSPAQALGEQESAGEVSTLLRWVLGSEEELKEPHVVILPVQGAIAMGGSGPLSDDGIYHAALSRTLTKLRKDESVRAVVLRIDSPGGSALASDLLWHELVRLRGEKPVVASLGSVAASGGYYMACAATEIVADSTSIVGSIGVVGGKFSIGEALAEYGVSAHTFAASPEPGAGARATYASLLTPWDDATRERVRRHMSSTYELFLERVALGRKLSTDDVREVAEGRVWSGAQGHENGLIDHLGGVLLAVERARALAELPAETPTHVHTDAGSLLELLGLSEDASDRDVQAAVALQLRAARPGLLDLLSPAQRRYLASFSPLAGPENVVVALPFVLEPQ